MPSRPLTDPLRHRRLAAIFLALLVVPLATAGTSSWDTLAEGVPRQIRGLHVAHGLGFAVGDAGLMLQLVDENWTALSTLTDRTMHDVRIRAPDHAVAVGDDGVVLEYDRAFTPGSGHPNGVQSAYGASGTQRRTEWAIPLWRLATGSGDDLGIGVEVRAGSAAQRHPAPFLPELARTASSVLFNDLPYATPTVDGTQESLWTNAVHATYSTGPVPFSLYLVRDSTNLYVLVAGGPNVALDHVLLQFHQDPGQRARTGDLRLEHAGTTDATRTHGVIGQDAAWRVTAQPGATTGVGPLFGAAFLNADTPLAVGGDGKLLRGSPAGWLVETIATGKTLRAVDVRENSAYIVGGSAAGDTGAVVYRYNNGQATPITVPAGTYALHDIDVAACRAVGSNGAVLTCLNNSPNGWTLSFVSNQVHFLDVVRGPGPDGVTWAAGRYGADQSALYYHDGASWRRFHLPGSTSGPATALGFGLGGPIVATTGLDILVLRPHAPRFVSLPALTIGEPGEPIRVPIQTYDGDLDVIEIFIETPDDFPPDQDIDIIQIDIDVFELVWIPSPDVAGEFEIELTLSDGDFQTHNGTVIIVPPQNQPPYWDPHPDVIIPHSLLWTTTAQAHDPDNDPLVLTALTLPPGAVFQDLGAGQAQVDWTPLPGDVGAHIVTLRADDGQATADLSFDVLVIDDLPPVITVVTPMNPHVCVKGPHYPGTITFTAFAHDPEGGPLNYTWTFSDDASVAYGQTVTHTYTTVGNFTVTLVVTDSAGLQTILVIHVRVDDCIFVRGAPQDPCFFLLDNAYGWIEIYDHNGLPVNGTYRVQAWWKPPVGPLRFHETTGNVTNGQATWHLPYDNAPTPLGDPVLHKVYIEGRVPVTAHGDTERMTVVSQYFHSPHCRLVDDPLL